ncbi:glycosyl transferase [Candidatus Azambacteria bacterium RIFCSPHIGHO2_02_FULL_52_12]|uniref:Glycosyl transferase n=1 Tax=Candidatus Azambacteria bacterium RIFCSPLOWO2_01_FULL_46_25 TaxID=1797298 RepID=A0A1F5BVK9_9BACT|nr:MAG: glycosyl transferase [Candidatus Azambacteria bacterium RIFCSPHIGHO2_02_FULL_52_12]OGD34642.1 MAG: glycosyl transferase [Candidatus Azambacteria bacterium RIFCSPLOWO2_01_FULL_46_25]
MKYETLSIIIPVYNEKRTITEVVSRIQNVDIGPIKKEILIIDDGSTDGTREIIKTIPGVRHIFNEKNQGKGGVVKIGFENVTGDMVIIQDADLEYHPNDYPSLIAPILDGYADAVFGSRFLTGKPHKILAFHHYRANIFLTFLAGLCNNINFTDVQTGYKVFTKEVVGKLAPLLETKRFGIEIEMAIRITRMKVRMYEVGIAYYGRSYAEGKKINWKDGVAAIWHIIKFSFFR